MQIIAETTQFNIPYPTAVAIGKFDGIHLGHQKLLHNILQQKEKGWKSTIFTFDPTPAEFFSGKKQKELMTKEEKRKYFAGMGIDYLIEFPLNAHTAATPPQDFVKKILCEKMNTHYITAGTDLSYGDKGLGDIELLQQLSREEKYRVEIVDKLCLNGREISSTYVREAVTCGDMELAATLLGRPYSVGGTVVHGNALGRTIDTPTANLIPPGEKLLPPNGVYVSETLFEGKRYQGMTNIGCKPTIGEKEIYGVETNLFDVELDLYGKNVEVFLYKHTRPERKFSGLEELTRKLALDKRNSRFFFTMNSQNTPS